nr:hypothetical protein Iba_chr11dCG9120 [Ipomoea batatas]
MARSNRRLLRCWLVQSAQQLAVGCLAGVAPSPPDPSLQHDAEKRWLAGAAVESTTGKLHRGEAVAADGVLPFISAASSTVPTSYRRRLPSHRSASSPPSSASVSLLRSDTHISGFLLRSTIFMSFWMCSDGHSSDRYNSSSSDVRKNRLLAEEVVGVLWNLSVGKEHKAAIA